MSTLYEHIRAKNTGGLQHGEAVQLFLWIYCSADILPVAFRAEPIGKEMLVDTFERLTQDGLIIDGPPGQAELARNRIPWDSLVDALLAKRVELDGDFPARISRYL